MAQCNLGMYPARMKTAYYVMKINTRYEVSFITCIERDYI